MRYLSRSSMAALCPVCVGLGDGPMASGANAGIATLMAVTVIVITAMACVAWSIARRARLASRAAAQPVAEA